MSFDEFWKVYPKKVGIGNARGQWPWAINKASAENIIDGALRYAAYIANNAIPWEYIISPARWLSEEHWTDVLPEPSTRDEDLELKAQAKIIARGDKFGIEYRERLPRQRIEEMVSKGYLTKLQAGRVA